MADRDRPGSGDLVEDKTVEYPAGMTLAANSTRVGFGATELGVAPEIPKTSYRTSTSSSPPRKPSTTPVFPQTTNGARVLPRTPRVPRRLVGVPPPVPGAPAPDIIPALPEPKGLPETMLSAEHDLSPSIPVANVASGFPESRLGAVPDIMPALPLPSAARGGVPDLMPPLPLPSAARGGN